MTEFDQPPTVDGAPSARAIDALRRTRPWTMFISILGFIGAGIMGLGAIAMAVGGVVGAGFGGAEGAAMVLGMSALYAVLAVVYVVISVSLFKYARAIGALVQTGRGPELEDALEAQRGFWKLMGIVIIVMMALMMIAFIVGIVAAVAIGASSSGF